MNTKHIVIVGGGFGGIYTAKYLHKFAKRGEIKITLINDEDYFLFTPLLHEVATGGLSTESVNEGICKLFSCRNMEFKKGRVENIDNGSKSIDTDGEKIKYDYLIIASGAKTTYYGIPGADEHSLPLKTLTDAIEIKRKVAEVLKNTQERSTSIAIVGGGPTGVELAGELVDFTSHLKPKHATKITIVDGNDNLLHNMYPKIQEVAHKRLERLGVNIVTGKKVQEVESDKINFNDNSIQTDLIIWTAGVTSNPPDMSREAMEKIEVDEYLEAMDEENVFALGDVARMPKPLPMLAQVAVGQAKIVARNIIAKMHNTKQQKFEYRSKGVLVSIGQWFAVGEIFNIIMSGWFVWWIWRTVYLFKFISNRKKLRVASEWTKNLFCPRDIN